MSFWMINFGVFVLYAYILKHRRRNMTFLILAIVHFTVISALRNLNVGTDTLYYARAYKYLASHNQLYWHAMSNSRMFIAYLKLCAKLMPNIYSYTIITSVPFMLLIGYFIYNYSYNYYYSYFLFIFMYFFFNSMNTARQYLAMGMVLTFFYLFDQKKYLFALILGVISVGVHSAALPCIIICAVISIVTWTPNKTLFTVISINLMNFLMPTFVNIFIRFVPQYTWIKKYLFTASYMSKGRSALVYFLYGEISIIVGLYWLYWYHKKIRLIAFGEEVVGKENYDQHTFQIMQRMIVIVAISAMIYLFYSKAIMFNRMASTLNIFIIVLLSNVLDNLKGKARIVGIIAMLPLTLFTYYQIKQGIASITNYGTFLAALK